MNLLIKNVHLIDPSTNSSSQLLDLFIENGILKNIESNLQQENVDIFDAQGACASPGWLDVGVQACDPGYEHREDLHSAARAAAAGGFTAIAVQPNTNPVLHSKSEISYIKKNTQDSLIDFYPIGAISEHCEGKDLTEMLDMRAAGGIAFSDGKRSVQHNGLMLRALQYVQAFDGVIINAPSDKAIATDGQMHEGLVSTSLGLKGIPNLAEELMVERDLHLLEYTGSKLHIANISTAGAVGRIRKAKAAGLRVTASVPVLNLLYTDEAVAEFDANFKVLPPLRQAADREVLIAGLQDDTIDCISSNHTPIDEEGKNLEFSYANFGVIGLETAFSAAWTALHGRLPLEKLIEKLAITPRRIFNLPIPRLEVGQPANLTLFDPNQSWIFQQKDIQSKSNNTPFIGFRFRGKVLAVVNNRQSAFFNNP
jgi:dihydroorotase